MNRPPYNRYYYGFSPPTVILAALTGVFGGFMGANPSVTCMFIGIITFLAFFCMINSDERVVRGKE